MLKIYVKKSIKVPAIEWTGDNLFEIITFTQGKPNIVSPIAADAWHTYTLIVQNQGLKISTLEGEMSADIGDFIIKGVKGEFYPCKPDIFALTYYEVEDNVL